MIPLKEMPQEEFNPKITHEKDKLSIEFYSKIDIIRSLEQSGDDIISVCQNYYKWLESIVAECENRFNK